MPLGLPTCCDFYFRKLLSLITVWFSLFLDLGPFFCREAFPSGSCSLFILLDIYLLCLYLFPWFLSSGCNNPLFCCFLSKFFNLISNSLFYQLLNPCIMFSTSKITLFIPTLCFFVTFSHGFITLAPYI